MSEVKANDQTEIRSADDVLPLYQGVDDQGKAGIEVELSFFNPKDPDLAVMSLSQNRVLKHSAMATLPEQDWVHNEPTSELLEVASIARPFAQMQDVLDDTNRKIKILTEKAEGIGLKRSYFQELPNKTADDLLSRIVDVERYHIMYAPYRADMKKCVDYFAVCKSNQVSISPSSADHMLKDVRRLYTLAPFLFLLTDNSSGFNEGKKFDGHIGMSMRHDGLTEGRGGIPPYVYTAGSGAEFIDDHIAHVMRNPLFMYYDNDGVLTKVPSGDWSVTFNSLRDRGLNTASNYYLAQSLMWPDVKIATLKDKQDNVFAHRYEARMFGVGAHQHQTAFILTSALAFHDTFAAYVDALLMRYGFGDDDLTQTYDHVLKAYKAARNHNGAFFDIPYGTGTMAKFAREFADLVEDISIDINMEEALQPLLTICRTGCTDGKVNRALFPTLDDVIMHQRHHDSLRMTTPHHCARMMFEKDLAQRTDAHCHNIANAP